MAASQLFRLGSINGQRGVLVALQHNKRTMQAERGADSHIDPTKSPLNYALCGEASPNEIATNAKIKMLQAGIDQPRKNAVMAVEVVFSLPIDRHQQDTRPFFNDCMGFVQRHFKGELLAFDVHLDESAPHAHALILPLVDGKMQGDKIKGDRANLRRLNDLFHAEVGRHYGLSKIDGKRLSSADRKALARWLINGPLRNDPAKRSDHWPFYHDAIYENPILIAQLLGLEIEGSRPKRAKSFAGIMTSAGKGRTVETKNPIGN